MMDGCQRIRDLLLEYALGTGEQARSRSIEDHLAGCPACEEALSRLRDELVLLRTDSVRAQELTSEFRSRFWSEVERRKVARRWWAMPGLFRWAAPATTLALLLAVGWIVHRHAPPAPAPPIQVPTTATAPPPTQPAPAPATPPPPPPPQSTAVQQATSAQTPSVEVLQDIELMRYLQYMDMIEGGEASGEVVLPGENGT